MAPPPTLLRSADFIDTIGVNTQIPYTDGQYANIANVIIAMNYVGIKHMRTGVSTGDAGSAPISSYTQLANAGMKFCVLSFAGGTLTNQSIATELGNVAMVIAGSPANSVIAIEGPNEINNFNTTFNGITGINGAVALQANLYSMVHSNSTFKNVNVVYFTGYLAGSIPAGPNPANTAGLCDYDNQHPYPNNLQQPLAYVNRTQALNNLFPPTGPAMYCETGYRSNVQAGGVSTDVQAKFLLNLYMDTANELIARTYVYMLLDSYAPGSPQGDSGFGLFDYLNKPKPSANALSNVISILKDSSGTATTFTPANINYTLTNLPSTGNSMVIQKSTGTSYISIWNEPTLWNSSNSTEIIVPATNVTVNFLNTLTNINVYDPMVGKTPIQTRSNTNSITVSLVDHPIFVAVPTSLATSFPLVDLTTQGKNLMTGLFNAWNQNIRLVCIQELYDQGDHYGLFSGYGVPKLGATYLNNLVTILNDPGANANTFITNQFNYSVLNASSTMMSTALQKSNGNTQVVVWNNIDNWNLTTGLPVSIPSTNISVSLATTGATANILVYDPINGGKTPIASATTARTISFGIADYPMIVDFSNVVNNIGGTTPQRAYDFLNMIGINGNVGSNASIYINSGTSIATDCQFIGAKHYRDQIQTSLPQLNVYQMLANAGINMILTPPNSGNTQLPTTLNVSSIVNGVNTIIAYANTTNNFVYALEGCDTPIPVANNLAASIYPVTFNGTTSNTTTFMPVANFMSAYFNFVNTIPSFNTVPMYSTSAINLQPDNTGMQFLYVPNGNNTGGLAGTGGKYGGGGGGTSISNGVPGFGGQGIIVVTNIPTNIGFSWIDAQTFSLFTCV